MAIDSAGPPIDFAVKMCRFQQEQLLDVIATREGLDETLLRALAMELADVHARLPSCYPDPESSKPGTPAALREAGYPVIIDATFLQSNTRAAFRTLAAKLSVSFVIIDCVAAPEELRRQLIERERLALDASEADLLILERQLATAEVLSGEEQALCLEVESTGDAGLLWQRLQR
jgi:hypothetical protein